MSIIMEYQREGECCKRFYSHVNLGKSFHEALIRAGWENRLTIKAFPEELDWNPNVEPIATWWNIGKLGYADEGKKGSESNGMFNFAILYLSWNDKDRIKSGFITTIDTSRLQELERVEKCYNDLLKSKK